MNWDVGHDRKHKQMKFMQATATADINTSIDGNRRQIALLCE